MWVFKERSHSWPWTRPPFLWLDNYPSRTVGAAFVVSPNCTHWGHHRMCTDPPPISRSTYWIRRPQRGGATLYHAMASIRPSEAPKVPRWRPVHFREVAPPAHDGQKVSDFRIDEPIWAVVPLRIMAPYRTIFGQRILENVTNRHARTQPIRTRWDTAAGGNITMGINSLLVIFWLLALF